VTNPTWCQDHIQWPLGHDIFWKRENTKIPPDQVPRIKPPSDPDSDVIQPPDPDFQSADGSSIIMEDKPRLVRAKVDTTNPEKLHP